LQTTSQVPILYVVVVVLFLISFLFVNIMSISYLEGEDKKAYQRVIITLP